MTAKRAKRAPHAPARDAPRVVSVEIPETDRRTPLAVAHVAVGAFTFAVGVVLPRSGWLEARPPLSILGKPAVATVPPELWEEIEAVAIAAVRADRAAEQHMTQWRTRRFQTGHGVPDAPPTFQPKGLLT